MPNEENGAFVGPAEETTEPVASEGGALGGVSRRTFLKAAALGTAAAALMNQTGGGGIQLGPLSAFANDLSTLPCTANDVNIIGPGQVINEPCTCSGGTFTATVQFTVQNGAGAGRYCIALHLAPATINGGSFGGGLDILLNTKPDGSGSSTALGKQNTIMYGQIPNFPCNTGGTLVCFGTALSSAFSGKCAANTCTTLAWSTSSGAAGCAGPDQSPPGGQCRHLQVCIQGFGAALSCSTGCSPNCGGTSVLTGSVSGGISPYVFQLSDGTSIRFPPSGTTATTSHDFTVTVTTNTTYTLTVTDSSPNGGCSRTATASLSANPLTLTNLTPTTPLCSGGATTLTASPSGLGTYSFAIIGTSYPFGVHNNGTSNVYTTMFPSGDYSATATVTSTAGCTATQSNTFSVPSAVTISAATATPPHCAGGATTLASSASGGTGALVYVWTEGGPPILSTANGTVNLSSGTHTLLLTVTDSNNCPATQNVGVTVPTAVTITTATATPPLCAGGATTLASSASGGTTPYSYAWTEGGGQPILSTANGTVNLSSGTHSLLLTVTDSNNCPATTNVPVTVPPALTASLGLTGPTNPCNGVLTFLATPSGGTAPYSYTWKIDGVTADPTKVSTAQDTTSSQLTYGPVLTGCHTIQVRVTDTNGCSPPAAIQSVNVNQCATTTLNCAL
jgi:TAT (twin-arginine translocation) pathway signal sequence